MADIVSQIRVDHPTDGRTDITDRVNSVEIVRGSDRQTGRPKAGVCRITSVTAAPWVGPWRSSGTWYEGDLLGAWIDVRVKVAGSTEVLYRGVVDEVAHSAAEDLNRVTISCLDLWGEQIAHAYLDVPAFANPDQTRARFNALMKAAGYSSSVHYTGTAGQRNMAPAAAKPKKRLVAALQEVVDSENGYLFVDRFNVLHFVGHQIGAKTSNVLVSDTRLPGSVTPAKSPEVVLDRERLSNAVIVVAADATTSDLPYDNSWGTVSAGSPPAGVSYAVPWDSNSGTGKGGSGASETVRSDAASIAQHGRFERRQLTGLAPTDARGLADELLRERALLRPVVPNVEVRIDAESDAVAITLLRLDLDQNLQLEVHARSQPFLYADLASIEAIRYRIAPLDMGASHSAVTATYTLYRGSAPSWWQVGVSSLGSTTVVGAPGLTATPGAWVDGEIVDVDGLSRVAAGSVARYADELAEARGEALIAARGNDYRYSLVESTGALRQYDTAVGLWRTVGTFA